LKAKLLKKISKAKAVKSSLFCLLIFFVLPVKAKETNINPIVYSAYREVLNLDFNKAREKLNFVSHNPESMPYALYVANLNDALEVYLSDDETLFDQYKDSESSRLKKVARLPDNLPEKYFLEAEIRIHWAFVNFKFGHYFNAFWGFKQAFSSAKTGMKLFPDFIPYKKSLGVLHTISGSFPENYSWMLSILNMEGEISEGMNELNEVVEQNSEFSYEAIIYQSIFQTYLLNENEKAILKIYSLLNKPNQEITLQLVASVIFMRSEKSAEAEKLLAELQDQKVDEKIPFINYLIGTIFLQKADYLNAIQQYQIFLNQFNGQNFIKDAYCKIAICHWLNNDPYYSYYISKAREEGQTVIDTDKNAESMIEQESLPNKLLLKMRYATDGGYFGIVEKILESTTEQSFHTAQGKIEFHYRKARYYHKTNHLSEALREYQAVISVQEDNKDYFAANSSLQCGYIYLSRNNYNLAKQYFVKAKSYKNHPYKYSIDKKADIEIEKIERKG